MLKDYAVGNRRLSSESKATLTDGDRSQSDTQRVENGKQVNWVGSLGEREPEHRWSRGTAGYQSTGGHSWSR